MENFIEKNQEIVALLVIFVFVVWYLASLILKLKLEVLECNDTFEEHYDYKNELHLKMRRSRDNYRKKYNTLKRHCREAGQEHLITKGKKSS